MKKKLLLIISLLSVFMLILASCSNPAIGPYDKELADKLLVPNGKYVSIAQKKYGQTKYENIAEQNATYISADGNIVHWNSQNIYLQPDGSVKINSEVVMKDTSWKYENHILYITRVGSTTQYKRV